MTYTDKNWDTKTSWDNVDVMMENGNGPYILIQPWVNFAGFPREEGRSHLIIGRAEEKARAVLWAKVLNPADSVALRGELSPNSIDSVLLSSLPTVSLVPAAELSVEVTSSLTRPLMTGMNRTSG